MTSHPAPDFGALLARITRALEARGVPFMLIGGQAVLLHGEPRLTQDVDITLGVGPRHLGEVLDVCVELGLDPLPEDVEGFVSRTFVLPARDPASGIRVDLIFSTTPYEAEAIARAVRVSVAGAHVPFSTAEDLIVHKLFAGRPRDLEDVAGVIRRKGPDLDWGYLAEWVERFSDIEGRGDLPSVLEDLRRSNT
jgi:predicted nucleotidyltransferase